jgi:protein gp37
VGPHCEKVSPGCEHCYSESNNGRCLPTNGTGLPFDRRARDLVEIFVDENILRQPFRWKKPRRVFVCSQTDLFGEFVDDGTIDSVMSAISRSRQHMFQILTKRADRMVSWVLGEEDPECCFPNAWLGFSAETQKEFDERWAHMRELARAGWLVWCSAEPLLDMIDMRPALKEGLRWVVVGGESGPGARPCNPVYISSIVEQCKTARVPCFVKQLGRELRIDGGQYGDTYRKLWPTARWWSVSHPHDYRGRLQDPKGADPLEWPAFVRVREFPRPTRKGALA